MPKAYWVTSYRSISNPDAVAAYAKLASPALAAAGGRVLVRGGKVQAYEAGKDMRTVVVEFDSMEKAVAARESQAYQQALQLLGDGAERDCRIVEGME
jgi:uncharacterized protein (DUF1330 family)